MIELEKCICVVGSEGISKAEKKDIIKLNKKKFVPIISSCKDWETALKKVSLTKGHALLYDKDCNFQISPVALQVPPKDWDIVVISCLFEDFGESVKDHKGYYTGAKFREVKAFIVNKNFKSHFRQNSFYHPKCKVYFSQSNIVLEPQTHTFVPTCPMLRQESEGETLVQSEETSLPFISLITPIYSDKENEPFSLVLLLSFLKLNYPDDRLEWIIVDDTPKDEAYKRITDILPNEINNIKYYKVESKDRLSLGKKLNIGVAQAKGEYILHFFNKHYYTPDSVMDRVTYLEQSKFQIIGCTKIGVYNIMGDVSFEDYEVDPKGNQTVFKEGSMAYSRKVWEFRNFNEGVLYDNNKNVLSVVWLQKFHNIMGRIDYSKILIRFSSNSKPEVEKTDYNFTKSLDSNILQGIESVKNDIINLRK